MSKIYVTNINDLPRVARRIQPSGLISLVPMEEQPRTPSGVDPARHLRLLIHDITTSDDAGILPQAEHIQTLIDFIRGWKQQDGPLLLHCIAGVSRSPAAALIALVTLAPGHEHEAARALRCAGPHFVPNRRMIQLADDILVEPVAVCSQPVQLWDQQTSLANLPPRSRSPFWILQRLAALPDVPFSWE